MPGPLQDPAVALMADNEVLGVLQALVAAAPALADEWRAGTDPKCWKRVKWQEDESGGVSEL